MLTLQGKGGGGVKKGYKCNGLVAMLVCHDKKNANDEPFVKGMPTWWQ